MRSLSRILIVVATALAASCGSSGGSGGSSGSPASPSTVNSLAGSWKATKAEFVNTANSSQRTELVALGTTLVLTLDSAGTYTQKITDAGQAGQTTTGTWKATTETLALTPTGVTWSIEFNMSLAGSILTLNGGHVAFDLDGDGRDEETIANLTLGRQ